MINKKTFFKHLGITQGRHLKKIKKKIQLFPDKKWKYELRLFNQTKLRYIEWVVSIDNYHQNPICLKNGFKIINQNLRKNRIKCRSVDLDFIVKEDPLNFPDEDIRFFLKKIKLIAHNSIKIGVKYLILPFLENSSPNNKARMNKLALLINKLREQTSKKIFLLIETDLEPFKLQKFIKKMKNKVYINYDIGNSASMNYDFEKEKKYFEFVKNIHLKDRIKNGSTIRFGLGNANFIKIFKYLAKSKNKFDFTLQPARSDTDNDIKEIKLNIKYLNNLITTL
jgi:L-ribulose-5-phosphate 3-epimerase